jgi:predicted MPP superfamily phosphohydrolase
VNEVSIADDALSGLLHDKKVVQISDLHITAVGYRERKLIRILNEIKPDLLFITGDLLKNGSDTGACLQVLSSIKKPAFGIWAVLGNTDRNGNNKLKINIDKFVADLEGTGIRVLVNSRERLTLNPNRNDQHLHIVGVEGEYLSTAKLNWLLQDLPGKAPVILLSHYPDVIEEHADGLTVNLEEKMNMAVSGWGWQDNAYYDYDSGFVRFERTGKHTLRVQRREDGVAIEQIVMIPCNNRGQSPRSLFDDCVQKAVTPTELNKQLPTNSVVIYAEDVLDSRIYGNWKKVVGITAASQTILADLPDSGEKVVPPLLNPEHYFEVDFHARGDIYYHLWVKMKAMDDSISSDSIYIQFDDSINEKGEPNYRIGELAGSKQMERINLVLAGHTHGGQVRLPLIGALDIVPYHKIKYDLGLFDIRGTKLYVNRGIGTTVLPVRFLSPPEITLFRFSPS